MNRDFFLRLANLVRGLWLMIGVTLLMLVGLELIARAGFFVRDVAANGGFDFVDERARAEVYRGADWAADYWREEAQSTRSDWRSYVYFRRAPFHGKYINVDVNGIRATTNKPATPAQIKIFMLGGSALWGMGARDEFTIPSQVSKKLAAKNMDASVTNFGEDGYVSTQEIITLELELQKGNVPDVVIFYDGANDVFSAFQQNVAGIPQNEFNRAAEFNQINWRGAILNQLALYRAITGLVTRPRSRSDAADAELANAVLERYAGNGRIVQSLSSSYGFSVYYFWQPTIYTKRNVSAWEKTQFNRNGEEKFFRQVNQTLAQRNLSKTFTNFSDLSDVFGDDSNSVFMDMFHISEAGNDRVAEKILQTLPQPLPRLKSLGSP